MTTNTRLLKEQYACMRACVCECVRLCGSKGHARRNVIVDDTIDDSSSTMALNVAKIASSVRIVTKSSTISLRAAGP